MAIDSYPSLNVLLEHEYTSIYRPLEFEYALDTCGNFINSTTYEKKILVIVDDEVLLYKMLNRAFREIHIGIEKNRELHKLIESNPDFKEKTVLIEDVSSPLKQKFDLIIWMTKCVNFGASEKTFKNLCNKINQNGNFIILFSHLLSYESREGSIKLLNQKEIYSSLRFPFILIKNLENEGFSIREIYGFHTPKNIIFSFVMKLCKRLGRSDLEDRVYFKKFKDNFITTSWSKYLSTFILINAEKGEKGDDRH